MARSGRLTLDDLLGFFREVSRNPNVSARVQYQAAHWYRALALDCKKHASRPQALKDWGVSTDDGSLGPNLSGLVEDRIEVVWQGRRSVPAPTARNFSQTLRMLAKVRRQCDEYNLNDGPSCAISENFCNQSTLPKKHLHLFRYMSLDAFESQFFKGRNKSRPPRRNDRRDYYTPAQIERLNQWRQEMLLGRPQIDFGGQNFAPPVFLCFSDDAPHLHKLPRREQMHADYIAERLGLPDWLKWGDNVRMQADKREHGIVVLRVRRDTSDAFYRPTKLLDAPGHGAFTPGPPDNVPRKNKLRYGLTRVCEQHGLKWHEPTVTPVRGCREVVMANRKVELGTDDVALDNVFFFK